MRNGAGYADPASARPEHLRAAQATRSDVDALLDALARVVERVEIRFLWRPQLKDPNDDMVLEAAVNGRAAVIVTFNRRDFAPVTPRFGIEAVMPRDLIGRL